MDNLTHSLIGAALGQAGLKRKTGLAMPALIIAANLPDIDAVCVVFGTESLAMRRGITHGPIALALQPALLAGGLILFDRWQTRRGRRPAGRAAVHPGWLAALCYLGALTHPAFDWLNNYGIRLLEPFSSQWFYGDALFIVDPWLLAILGGGIWLSLRRERSKAVGWAGPAQTAIVGVLAYVALNIGISAEAAASASATVPQANLIVTSPVPLRFWKRDMLVRTETLYGRYESSPLLALRGQGGVRPHNMADPRISARVRSDPAARAFLFWSRMPIAEVHDDFIVLRDQRFMDQRATDMFAVTLRPPQ